MGLTETVRRFEQQALVHLNAAYNLARWLLRDDHAAEDVVQESFLRALKYYDSLRGEDIKPWLLSIVRNTCYTWLQANKRGTEALVFDEERDSDEQIQSLPRPEDNPEALLTRKQESAQIRFAIERLPVVFREAIILRELEELSYEEIAMVMSIPLGTVMSRLARARAMLRTELQRTMRED